MAALERPRLRSHLAWEQEEGGSYVIRDQLRLAVLHLRLSRVEMSWLHLFDGQRTLADIESKVLSDHDGLGGLGELFHRLVRKLDDALFFDGPRFRSRLREHAVNPIRPPACTASYGEDPDLLRRSLERLFTAPGGPGRPGPRRPDPHFRAALIPHIDYGRGGRAYAWAFKEVFEHAPAALFVIIGTSHYSYHRFTLTRKHFQTPLGIVPIDQAYIDRLVAHYGGGLFDDELPAHLPEHSIELEVVFLQYLFPDTPFRIVPLVVGSFHDCIARGRGPVEADDIGRMIAALRAAERETKEPIFYIISGDLAHLGPKFRDPEPVHSVQLESSRSQDLALLHELGAGVKKPRRTCPPDAAAYFRIIADEGDARRICGLPPTYTVLEALHPSRGEVLHYDQYIHPLGYESVSFASVVFYKDER
ncbi:MAG TPA: AmmeMemoRadiSam system protein B [Gemmataceae bacterium]|nr:AmmeMemoRadiSam system protein B [Gemmataceae bacterium]